MINVILTVHSGGSPIRPDIAAQLASRVGHVALTEREQQVMELLASGLKSAEIATTLGIAKDTVHVYLRSIFGKLDVHDRLTAVAVAIKRGLIRSFDSADNTNRTNSRSQ